MSLFKEHNHIVVDVHADVAVRLILNRETAPKQAQTVPRLVIPVVELSLYVLRDVRIVARPETLQRLDRAHHRHLRHLWIHVVPLNPNPPVRILPIDVQRVPVVARHHHRLRPIRAPHSVSLNLSGHYFYH